MVSPTIVGHGVDIGRENNIKSHAIGKEKEVKPGRPRNWSLPAPPP